jgi:HK97 family phage major capsid protein
MELTQKQIRAYSLRKAIDRMARQGVADGFELELSQQCEKETGERCSGLYVPWQVLASRDMNVTTFGEGGAFVQTTVAQSVIALLRNSVACLRLGATPMYNLKGNLALPRQTSATTAQTLNETATTTVTSPTIDQVLLTPRRVSASVEFSRELQLQSSVDVEQFIRDDLMRVLAIKWDKMMLEGSGTGSEPTGILNLIGAGSVHFGTTPTLAKMVEFESSLANANAILNDSKLGYLTSPSVRAVLKTTPKIGATFPIFIWEKGEWNDSSDDGLVNGYRAAVTNQVSNNLVYFADWKSLIFAVWGAGPDVIVNPFSRDTEAMTRITIHSFSDVAARHPQSFAISDDAGNQ